jgi:hypothetical protein
MRIKYRIQSLTFPPSSAVHDESSFLAKEFKSRFVGGVVCAVGRALFTRIGGGSEDKASWVRQRRI